MLSLSDKDLTIDAAHAGNIVRQTITTIFELFTSHSRHHISTENLFLLVVGLLSLRLGTLLTDTNKTSLRARVTELPVRILGSLVVANSAFLELDDGLGGEAGGEGTDGVLALLGGLDVLGGCVTALGLAVAYVNVSMHANVVGYVSKLTTREENEALLELLEALYVGLEALLGEVLAAGVDLYKLAFYIGVFEYYY